MKPNTPEQPAPESYATFWEPIAVEIPPPAPPAPPPAPSKDAYLEFVDVTEDTPVPARTKGA
jgi:hypothetical protein